MYSGFQLASFTKILKISPDQCGSVGWVLYHRAKGHQFYSWSEHMLGLQVWSLVGAHMRGNQSMFLSHIDVSFPLFLPPSPCL